LQDSSDRGEQKDNQQLPHDPAFLQSSLGLGEVRTPQDGVLEVGASQVGMAEVGSGEILVAKVLASQVGVAKVAVSGGIAA
jgi:hypothetical protein